MAGKFCQLGPPRELIGENQKTLTVGKFCQLGLLQELIGGKQKEINGGQVLLIGACITSLFEHD
jgi:hypothetical protein